MEWTERASLSCLSHHKSAHITGNHRAEDLNVGDVASDSSYLTALDSTRAEIIVPILDDIGGHVIGTIDVESEHLNAFDSKAQALLEESANVLTKFWTSGN